VAGAGSPELGDTSVNNLIPMVFERLDSDQRPRIFGDDYNTPDGTCIRDYIHVVDLAEAHLAALENLKPGHRVYNVGTGTGSSVREIIDLIRDISGSTHEPVIEPRRPGDPDSVVATVDRIRDELGWSARLTTRDAVESAWTAHAARRWAPSPTRGASSSPR
ncbi:MAG TPA: GDP-mannose 4,6-dehydratase, partial [Terrimesophilobacter sp.]|nr:GDP-mannose 4,6-dehydratase [Terrimesophilobacter sp.]